VKRKFYDGFKKEEEENTPKTGPLPCIHSLSPWALRDYPPIASYKCHQKE
jgi:hypothetical protein